MAVRSRQFAAIVGLGGLTLLLCAQSLAQQAPIFPHRSRDGHVQTGPQLQGVAANSPAPAQSTSPAGMALAPAPINLLQEPAKAAQVGFANDRLSIHADNASLAAILREVAAQSGMKVTGLGSDERVFGTFGPAAPSDVLDDLLHGTAYDVVLVGNANYGAPRELILTPARSAGQTQASAGTAPVQAAPDDAANEPETQEVAPPEAPPPPAANQPPTGVRTPQQLFQQLQQMRQAQQQQVPQQEQPQTQTPPPQP